MKRLFTTISQAFGLTETKPTTPSNTEPTEISETMKSDLYTPWKCIHHALRITVQILRPFVMSKLRELHSQCLLQKEQNNWDEKQLLNFLIDFDRRFEDRKKGKTPKGTVMQNAEDQSSNPKTLRQSTVMSNGGGFFFRRITQFWVKLEPSSVNSVICITVKGWQKGKPNEHPMKLAQCFCSMTIYKNELKFTSTTSIIEPPASQLPSELDFDATAVFVILQNCTLFEKYWVNDLSLFKYSKNARIIRNKMMHNQDMIIGKRVAVKAIAWLQRLVSSFNYEIPGEAPCLDRRREINYLNDLIEVCNGLDIEDTEGTTEDHHLDSRRTASFNLETSYNPVPREVSSNYRRTLINQRTDRASRSLTSLKPKRSNRRFLR